MTNREIFKEIGSYFLVSFAIVWGLLLIHYPPVFTTKNTIEFLCSGTDYKVLKTILFSFFWTLLFIPLIMTFKTKILGFFTKILFVVMPAIEMYLFYIQGGESPWNTAFDTTILDAYISKTDIEGAKDVIHTYSSDLHFWIYLIIFPVILYIAITFMTKSLKPQPLRNGIIALIFFVAGVASFPNTYETPYFYSPLKTVIDYTHSKMLHRKREKPLFTEISTSKQTPENIVYIMDESVRGDLISINNPNGKYIMQSTPYLFEIKDKLINFGNNFSLGNCSEISNRLFFAGARKKDLDISPTIMQYMQNAGYKTYYIDATSDRLIVGLSSKDLPYIDNYISTKKYPKLQRDFKALEIAGDLMRKPGKKFIYILKDGAHFPFDHDYDPKTAPLKIADNDSVDERFYKVYLNTLNQTVDKYWKRVVAETGDTDTVVLWQSDHAVNVAPDKGEKVIRLTHCERGFSHYRELYSIPSVMYTPKKIYKNGFSNLSNGYSVKHMFPTLLDLAGYPESKYIPEYGPSYKDPDKNVTLFTLYNLGTISDPKYNIDLTEDLDKKERSDKISELNKNRVFPPRVLLTKLTQKHGG